jgi:hypothetical protein
MLLRAAESHTTPGERKSKAGAKLGWCPMRLIKPPTSNMDEQLRAQQHQNELRAFLRYERRLKQAYARSQDPFPRRWQPDGHRRRVQVDG